MAETVRLLEAAAALSRILTAGGICHAFHGSILVSLLSKNPQCPVRIFIRAPRPLRLTSLLGDTVHR